MWMTFIALAVLAASLLLTLSNLRVVAQDTLATLVEVKNRAQHNGQVVPKLAFVGLWLMIFLLSFI